MLTAVRLNFGSEVCERAAPDVPLVGVAAGAAAADLESATPNLDGSFFSCFIAYGGVSAPTSACT